jgi:hypothetical protein
MLAIDRIGSRTGFTTRLIVISSLGDGVAEKMNKQRRHTCVVVAGGVVLAAVLFASVHLSEPTAPADSEPIDGRAPDEPDHVESTATAEADEDVDLHNTGAEDFAPPGIVSDEKPEISAEQMARTENVYRHPGSSVKADRYRFLHIDWDVFYEELERTQAYLAASSGRTPPPVYDDAPPTFGFAAFEDRSLNLLVTEVQFVGDSGSRNIVMDGKVVETDDSTFRLSTTEGHKTLVGRIDTPDFVIRVDTFGLSGFTTVAEFGPEAMEKAARVPIDFEDD